MDQAGTRRGPRTPTPLRELDFESSASANSAIRAWEKEVSTVEKTTTLATEKCKNPSCRNLKTSPAQMVP